MNKSTVLKWPLWKRWAFGSIAFAVLLLIVVGSEAVQDCIQDFRYHYAIDKPTGVSVLGFVLGAGFRCIGRYAHENSEILVALFTLGLVGVTGVLAYYTFNLWKETGRLATEAHDSAIEQARLTREAIGHAEKSAAAAQLTASVMAQNAERELRAYVGPDNWYGVESDKHEGIVVKMRIKNFGQTPAKDFMMLSGMVVAPYPLVNAVITDPTLIEGASPGRSVLLPTAYVTTLAELVKAEVDKAKQPGQMIYFFGVLHYVDAFGQPRLTRWRYMFKPSHTELISCNEGNEYT